MALGVFRVGTRDAAALCFNAQALQEESGCSPAEAKLPGASSRLTQLLGAALNGAVPPPSPSPPRCPCRGREKPCEDWLARSKFPHLA